MCSMTAARYDILTYPGVTSCAKGTRKISRQVHASLKHPPPTPPFRRLKNASERHTGPLPIPRCSGLLTDLTCIGDTHTHTHTHTSPQWAGSEKTGLAVTVTAMHCARMLARQWKDAPQRKGDGDLTRTKPAHIVVFVHYPMQPVISRK